MSHESGGQPITVLSVHDGHDAGACLLRDGRIVACSSEERRRNIKNFAGVPERSIAEVIAISGVTPSEIDRIEIVGLIRNTVPSRQYKPIHTVLGWLTWLGQTQWGTAIGRMALSKLRMRRDLMAVLAQHGLGHVPTRAVDHHMTHAACAYFHRPWRTPELTATGWAKPGTPSGTDGSAEPTLVLTLDGAGDGICATVSVAHGHTIRRIAATPKFHSIAAWFYSAITAHLGLTPYEHEYKVMGMAPYGQAKYALPALQNMFEVAGLEFRNRTGRHGVGMQRVLLKRLAGHRFDNVAAACQELFETWVTQWARNAVAATGVKRIAAAGGAFLNVKANKLLREMPEVDAFYAYPASDDGGTPVGGAILGYLDVCAQRNITPTLDLPADMYLGREFSDVECETAIRNAGLTVEKMASPAEKVAALLASGKIVARFAGREELGPRALGNRSILADPRRLEVIRKLNFAIKYRDFWMPFAASILAEDAENYLARPMGWPFYMIEAFDTTPAAADSIIAGMHPFDLTVRPQIVTDLNPGYRDLLRAFKAQTGVGAVLNTSFNLHGFPIVGTPETAIYTLKNSGLDALALGPFLVRQPGPTPG